MRKKTHEQYVEELKMKNPNIEAVDKYVNSSTKILHRCLIDGHEWSIAPATVLYGNGCPVCGGSMKKTHEQYVEELKRKNENIEVVGVYENIRTPIMHRCLIDGYEWYARPNNILRGRGCPVCGGTMQKTHDQYINELKTKNPSIVVVEKYINHTEKIKHKCLIHNYEWKVSPSSVLSGHGCPQCQKEKLFLINRRTHEQYIYELSIANENVIAIGEYINARIKIKHKCLICDYEWEAYPENLLTGHGCPMCSVIIAGEKRKKTHDEYIKEVKKINPNIDVLGEYVNAKTPILHRCKKDNHEWYTSPSVILNGSGCPKCNTSKGEKIIEAWLKENNICYKPQKTFDDCKHINLLAFDFYLPIYNICIEYQGKQHYEPIEYFGGKENFDKQILRDNIKEKYCKDNNITLFKIPYYSNIYDELENLHNLIIMKNEVKGVAV